MEKLVKDGNVAVLISPGYGAGWSTWMYEYPDCLFDGVLAQMLLDHVDHQEVVEYCEKKYPDSYLGGLDDLEVYWLPVGTHFRVNEYDGAESVEVLGEVDWNVA